LEGERNGLVGEGRRSGGRGDERVDYKEERWVV